MSEEKSERERHKAKKKVSRIWGRDGKETVSEQQKLKCGKEERRGEKLPSVII